MYLIQCTKGYGTFGKTEQLTGQSQYGTDRLMVSQVKAPCQIMSFDTTFSTKKKLSFYWFYHDSLLCSPYDMFGVWSAWWFNCHLFSVQFPFMFHLWTTACMGHGTKIRFGCNDASNICLFFDDSHRSLTPHYQTFIFLSNWLKISRVAEEDWFGARVNCYSVVISCREINQPRHWQYRKCLMWLKIKLNPRLPRNEPCGVSQRHVQVRMVRFLFPRILVAKDWERSNSHPGDQLKNSEQSSAAISSD